MKLNPSILACISLSKIAAIILSVIWLIGVSRYLQIKPEYATRDYLKSTQNFSKNSGIIRMNTITRFKTNLSIFQHTRYQNQNNFNFFNLLQLSQNKNRIDCQKQINLLIINTNYKSVGDSYLTLYKEIQKQNIWCKNYIYQFTRKNHLLMDSQILISHYVIQIAMVIQKYVLQSKKQNLIILTFQEGCALVLKAFQYLPNQIIAKIDNYIFINAYNPNILILNQPPGKFISNLQQRLINDRKKIQTLNQTKLIFINTINFWDPTHYSNQDQQKFVFLWGNKKLHKTLFLNTRFMRNVYMLFHQKDYFTSSNFVNKLVRYISNIHYYKKIQRVEYYFYYGETHTKVEQQFKDVKNKQCLQGRLNTLNKITRIISTPCLQIQIMARMKQKQNQTALIITSKKSYIFNNRFERIQPIFQIFQLNYYIFDRVHTTKQIWIVNQDKHEILIQFHQPLAPLSNPISNASLFTYSPHNYFLKTYKQLAQNRRIIKTCPHGNYLLYPQNFYNNLTGNSLLIVYAFYNINKIIYDYYQIDKNYKDDCYPDLFTQMLILPKQFQLNWFRERNIILFVLLCAYTKKQQIFSDILFYLSLTYLIHYLHLSLTYQQAQLPMLFFSILIVTICISIQKSIDIVVHLVKFIQDMLDIRYRQLMLILILLTGFIKQLKQQIINLQQVSAWKLLCISLIFVINKQNMLILIIKIYYLADYIVYNHNNYMELVVIIILIYVSLENSLDNKHVNQTNTNTNINGNNSNNGSIIGNKLCRCTPRINQRNILDTLFVGFSGLLIDSPSKSYTLVINGYIILKTLEYMLKKIRDKSNAK